MYGKDAAYCYGMSKMTNTQENTEAQKYDKLSFVEFLEMIGRVADFKFRGSELEDVALVRKIEHVLDELFVVLGHAAQRKSGHVDIEEATQSDSDY